MTTFRCTRDIPISDATAVLVVGGGPARVSPPRGPGHPYGSSSGPASSAET
ncbi:hypothetical protein [Nonomuraea deserti]|uniref:hypothetical protein n=1 Tax=Nonomuraea deserti TaxID=1848322 RepID=UPI001FE2D401|nr:hypothetical protein [Nonomuraea deserti]